MDMGGEANNGVSPLYRVSCRPASRPSIVSAGPSIDARLFG